MKYGNTGGSPVLIWQLPRIVTSRRGSLFSEILVRSDKSDLGNDERDQMGISLNCFLSGCSFVPHGPNYISKYISLSPYALPKRFILPCLAPAALHYTSPLSPNVFRDPKTPRSRHGSLSAPQHACHPACLPRERTHRCHVRQPPLRCLSLPLFRAIVLILRRRSSASSRVVPRTLSAASVKRSQTANISPRHIHHGAIGRGASS